MNNSMRPGEDFRDAVLQEQVRLAVKQLPAMQTASFIVALVLAYTVRRIVPFAEIAAWLLMVLGVVAGRSFLYIRFLKMGEEPFDGKRWENAYLILALVSGAIWGLSAFMIFPAGNIGLICLFVLAMASLSAATTVSHSSIRLGPTAWAGPVMLLYGIRSFMEGGEFGYTLGVLIILYLATILRYSFTQNSSVTSAISLKFENLGLLDEVRKANDALKRDIIERDAVAEALGKSENRYRMLFEHSPIGIFHYDVQLRITDCNDRFIEIFQSSREQLLGLDMRQLKEQGVLPSLLKATEGAEGSYEGLYHATTSPAEAWVSVRTTPVFGRDGKVAGCVGIVENITERKKAEESLLQLSLAVEQSPVSIVVTDLNGSIEYVNPYFTKTTGYSIEEAKGKNPRILKSGEKSREEYKKLWETISSGKVWEGEFHNKKKNLELYWEQAVIAPVKNREGVITHYIGIKQDITERKVAEERLRESEDRFRGAFETAAIGMAIRSLGGRWLKVNRSLCEIVGYSEEELLTKTFQDITHPDDLDTDLAYIRALLAGEMKYYRMEKRYFHKQGHIVWILLSVSLVRDAHHNPLYFITQIEDITERKKAEEMLRRLSTVDGLTGLANRRAFDEFLNNEWKRAMREKRRLSLMMIDIDFFKSYNDTYGHLEGDTCLRQVAGLLKSRARRPGDMAARFGGEEFVIVLEDADAQYAVTSAEEMRRDVEALKIVHAKSEASGYVTVSIGVAAILPQHDMSPVDLVRYADEALYEAKKKGRNRVSLSETAEPIRHS